MVEFKPFKGYLYNPEKVESISKVIAPPWDLIDEEIEERLILQSEYNIVKIISKNFNPEQAYKRFYEWIEKKILIEDEMENFYFMKTEFEFEGKRYERYGIFGILKLEDFEKGNIIPHERIFKKYTDNRYKLIEKCKANLEPVFMVYSDKEFKIEEILKEEKFFFSGEINKEKFWFGKVRREKIMEIMKLQKLFIADGHHRYNASLQYYKDNPQEKNNYILVYLTNIESEGVLILPTHRYIPCEVELKLNCNIFDLIEVQDKEEMKNLMRGEGNNIFGVFIDGKFFVLKIKEKLDGLNTEILHNFIIKDFLKIKENREFLYHSSEEYLLKEYEKVGKGIIFFLNPVKKEEFLKICLSGKIMPHKSTYFYPKVPSGLVIYKF